MSMNTENILSPAIGIDRHNNTYVSRLSVINIALHVNDVPLMYHTYTSMSKIMLTVNVQIISFYVSIHSYK